jgi:hypothetical protein
MNGYLKITIIENEFEAQLLKSILDERGITYYLRSYYDIAYDGLFQKSNGWGAIYAPKEYEKIIVETMTEIRNQSAL